MADNWILDGTIAERTMKPLYLDHAATAPPCAAALKAFNDACAAAYANPGSLHQPGADAARLITKSRNKILKLLNASNYKLAFTATGTESNRLGICGHHSSGVALVGATEHPSSLKTVESLNCDYRRVQVLQDGRIDLEDFKSKLNSDVSLVSMQWVNNELGCVQPLTGMIALTRQLAPNAHFHVDAIQAAGKFILHLDQIDADSFAIAAHKFGGIRGCAGYLYKKNIQPPAALFVGGGHEDGVRSGTENTMGIAAMAAALEHCHQKLISDPSYLHQSRQLLISKISEHCDVQILGPEDEQLCSGAIISLVVKGVRAEPFLHQLETHNIFIGSGSACNSHGHSESEILAAIELPQELRNSVLRISFSDAVAEKSALRVATAMALAAAFFKG